MASLQNWVQKYLKSNKLADKFLSNQLSAIENIGTAFSTIAEN